MKTVKLQTLRTHFETLKMTESKNVDTFMTRVMVIVNQIRLTGEAILDQRIVEKVLRSLPKKFEMVVTVILESKDLSNFSVDELMGSLLSHDCRLNLEDESMAHAFKSQFSFSRGRGHRGRGSIPRVTITQVKVTHIRINNISLKEEDGDPMTKPTYNVITAKSMATMNLNARRSKKIRTREEHMFQIMKEKR